MGDKGHQKLFVVRYLKWLPGFFNPVGVVVGVIPAGTDLPSSSSILRLQHHIPSSFPRQVLAQAQQSVHLGSALPADTMANRLDLSQDWCFTIDTPQRQDLQVAYGIEQVSESSYQVRVHTVDASYYLQPGTSLDQEALQRGTSMQLSGQATVPMLPTQLSEGVMSLKPGAKRCALSVFLTVTGSEEEWHVTDTQVKHTVVSSRHHFSHSDVRQVLLNIEEAEQDYLKSCVLVLYQIALMRRKQRKGNAHLDPAVGPLQALAAEAHHMVEELQVMTNHHVSSLLLQAFPSLTPLLVQPPPSSAPLEVWKAAHAADAINSVSLTRPYLQQNQVMYNLAIFCYFFLIM